MPQQTIEGTWEEIARQAETLAGQRVRLTILAEAPDGETAAEPSRTAGQLSFGMFKGDLEPTDEDCRSAEFRGDPDDGLDWK